MSGLYTDETIEALRQGAAGLAHHWDLSPGTTVSLLNISENATFLATDPEGGRRVVLRVHRAGYHTRAEIESELAWIEALRTANTVPVPTPLRLADGGHIATFEHNGRTRLVVGFAYLPGRAPTPEDAALVTGFHHLGILSARLHAHARLWRRPPGFVRKTWVWDTTVGPTPHWGDWRDAPGLEPDGAALLERTCTLLRDRLAAYGTGPERFGLIHADLRLANLLVDGPNMAVIDFDDCGFGWFGYDFAAAVSFLEHEPVVPALQAAWTEGYRSIARLSEEDEAMLPVLVMLRRLLLTAWIGSHPDSPEAAALGAPYTRGTLTLADDFLSRGQP